MGEGINAVVEFSFVLFLLNNAFVLCVLLPVRNKLHGKESATLNSTPKRDQLDTRTIFKQNKNRYLIFSAPTHCSIHSVQIDA